jgi:uncharacterized lipoprotein YddW (UPF0748 family)
MNGPRSSTLAAAVAFLALGACSHTPDDDLAAEMPPAPREFRAAWVATVANIDWPTRPGLPVAQQQNEAIAILDRLVALNMNAVVLQVRPQADAMYASELEPWSAYLTGQQGVAPDPAYDPLTFWVEEAHARGLQLHAWCNPYRANHPGNPGPLDASSVVNARPDLVVKLGSKGYWWMDPALTEVQDHAVAVVTDIVRRYDVDGIHFDDYFYPYPSYHDGQDFPDDASYAAYVGAGGGLSRGDWRRRAVDGFIERLADEIKAVKRHVAFGISPFGIWRPGHPPTIAGLDQYDVLYADARRWFREGWVDYLTPQLYWPIAQIPQSFPVLLGWWVRQNVHRRHLWPGTTIARNRTDTGATEIANQILITRGMVPDAPGICLFSMKWLQSPDHPVGRRLADGPFARRALIPASPWLDATPPPRPAARLTDHGGRITVSWTPADGEPAFLWVVTARRDSSWTHRVLPAHARQFAFDEGPPPDAVAVTAVDRCGAESPPAFAR